VSTENIAALFAKLDRELWVVTSAAGSRRGGLVATFVGQASIVPDLPRMLVGIDRAHHTWELIEASGAFALHLLDEEQLDWVWRFGIGSGRERDKLAELNVRVGQSGSPILTDALGWLDCRVEARLDTGDRTVYLAAVLDGGMTRASTVLTAQRMFQRAPTEKLRELKEAFVRDGEVDAAAIRKWRGPRG
jgi:flavin reductase (DIM6/NTAB) family NADH-FMN oxidoreductase RutF